jgi:hypothetical protein
MQITESAEEIGPLPLKYVNKILYYITFLIKTVAWKRVKTNKINYSYSNTIRPRCL